jgi:tetratricopeptide (TPR) repeat protein
MNWFEFYDAANRDREQQQWETAIVSYQQSIELNSDFFWSHHHLGDVFTKLQRWNEATIAYRRAIELDADFFWSHHNLGDALTKLQLWDEAILAYCGAILLKEDLPLIWQKLGHACRQRANSGLNLAINHYRKLMRDASPNLDRVWQSLRNNSELSMRLAEGLTRVHQLEGAILLYYMTLEIQPDAVEVLQRLGQLLQQRQQLESQIANNRTKITQHTNFLPQYRSNFDIPQRSIAPDEKIIFTTNPKIEPEIVEELYQSVGWASRPIPKVRKAIEGSFLVVSAWKIRDEQKKLVALARISSDGVFHATLLDVMVHPDFQSQGIGKALIQYVVQKLRSQDIEDIILFASPHIVNFYQKLGFVAQPNEVQWLLWCR